MCEILRGNFEERFHEISDAIEKSVFVGEQFCSSTTTRFSRHINISRHFRRFCFPLSAIDAEFTGLSVNDSSVNSLFDDASTRYRKLKKSVSQFVISQFGLCAFVENVDHPNRYTAYAYNFYLFQPSFGPIDCRFLCQTSSLEFLCQSKFDFNKFVHEGVPYLNKEEKKEIKRQHENHTLHCNMASYKLGDLDEEIKTEIAKIDLWLQTAKEGNNMAIDSENYFKQYLLLTELNSQYSNKNINCKVQNGFKIIITKDHSKNGSINSNFEKEINRIFVNIMGFSRIIQTLIKSKRPVIGHNLLTDLMLVYDKFISPLPDGYDDFKKALNEAFPVVCDTKHLAFKIRKLEVLQDCGFLQRTNLDVLHSALTSEEARFFVLYNPSIELADISQKYAEKSHLHEAGYDAYLSGYVFLRLAHLYTAKSQSKQLSRAFPFQKYLKVLQPYLNQLNIGRASIPYMNLAGDDPPSVRPQWFCVKSLGSLPLYGPEVARQFIRFGSVDVKITDPHHALVAVAYNRRVKDVLSLVKKNKKTIVRLYNPLYDSPTMKTVIWSGGVLVKASIFVSIGIFIWKVLK